MSPSCTFFIERAHGFQWNPGPLHSKTPNPYVVIYQDGRQIHRTRTMKRTIAPQWDEPLNISLEKPAAEISLKLFHDTSVPVRGDLCLGALTLQLDALLNLCSADPNSRVASLQLVATEGKSKGKPSGILMLRMEDLTPALAKSAIDDAQKALAASKLASANGGDLASRLKVVVTRLDFVLKIGDGVTQINPYANAAWKILTSVCQAIKKEQQIEDNVVQLVETMIEVYDFVEDLENLPQKIKRLENIVVEIAKQTLECAIFIREYTGHGFSGRLIRSTWADTNQKIEGFSTALLKVKESFDRGLALQSVFFSAKIRDDVESLVQSEKLKTLNPLNVDASLRIECLLGTRQDVLTAITEWLTMPSESGNILWLYGVAGAGKSTISTSISQYFRSLHRLGAFLFFDRNNPAGSSPGAVVRTIAYWMAASNSHIRTAICDAISDDATLVTAPIQTQFRRLILDPLLGAQDQIRGPVIVILDALDECGDPGSRRSLLSLIVDEFPKLPAVFRFLITSRPDSDIAGPFRTQTLITARELDIKTQATRDDILVYLHQCMDDIRKNHRLDATWPEESIISRLANYAAGLFIWASTAAKFIDQYKPADRLEKLLKMGQKGTPDLNALYTTALEQSGPWNDATFSQEARAVLSAVVFSRIPLTDAVIDSLVGLGTGTCSQVLDYLGCFVHRGHGKTVQLLHASFSDYLTDLDMSGSEPWFIDSELHSRRLALGCLQILNKELRFNICSLKDSRLLNVEIQDLSVRVETHISPQLSYASQYWADHLHDAGPDPEILEELKKFIHQKFLYWLEVLSLLQEVRIATDSLNIALAYVSPHEVLANIFQDALKFVAVFAPLIAQSAPHIYVSAIPLTPKKSIVRNQFLPSFPRTVRFHGPVGERWSDSQKVLHGHTSLNGSTGVNSVVFSPDGKRIASGAVDQTILVWDAETGGIIAGPFTGHTGAVKSIAFSPDGTRIVSGSEDGTLLIWDSVIGDILVATLTDRGGESPSDHGPLTGHTETIQSVTFSPDGKLVASGSSDGTLRVWDSNTGAIVSGPYVHPEGVSSVAFSPTNDSRIMSGCYDGKVRLWDMKTGVVVIGPLDHKRLVISVAFSPDGSQIAAGDITRNRAVKIWDSETGAIVAELFCQDSRSLVFSPDGKTLACGVGQMLQVIDSQTGAIVAGPFEGHAEEVTSVAFSPDAKKIVSGSIDNTVRVWDLEAGDVDGVPELSEGHLGRINSIAFSADGGRFASGSSDKTVRIWESTNGSPTALPFDGHNGDVGSVAFSPDHKWIVSGDGQMFPRLGDATVRVWDSETGALLAGPLEGHCSNVFFVEFLPDGTRIVSSCSYELRIWDSNTGAMLAGPFNTEGFGCVAIGLPGKQIMAGSKQDGLHSRVWDSETRTVRKVWDSETAATILAGRIRFRKPDLTAFSPDCGRIASSHGGTVWIWDSRTEAVVRQPLRAAGHPVLVKSSNLEKFQRVFTDFNSSSLWMHKDITRELPGSLTAIGLSRDGKHIISASDDRTIRVWSWEDCVHIAGPFEGHIDRVTSVAMSADEKQICAGSSEGVIMVWDRATGAQVAVLRGHGHEISFVAFSPDGTRIVSGSHDSTLRIWDSVSGAIVAILGGHTDSIISVDFSPDGKRFLSWSKDYTVRVWDSENGLILLGPLQADRKIKIEGFGFSPDGKLIISWKGLEIYHVVRQIWDSRTGVAINHRTDEHIEPITAVAWSPNGKQILTASQDKTVCVWDSNTGGLVAGPFVEHASVTRVIFSPDNTYIISCATPGFGDHINVNTIRAWKVENSGLWGNHPCFYDGWIINSAGEHIIWVPPWLRRDLCLPWNLFVISRRGTTKLDLTDFVHGTEWDQCIDPKFRDAQ